MSLDKDEIRITRVANGFIIEGRGSFNPEPGLLRSFAETKVAVEPDGLAQIVKEWGQGDDA